MSARRVVVWRGPEVERRERGVKRWAVSWDMSFTRPPFDLETRRREFFTRRGAERWLRRVSRSKWQPVEPAPTTPEEQS